MQKTTTSVSSDAVRLAAKTSVRELLGSHDELALSVEALPCAALVR
jgi:hypothetical protein